MSVLGHDLEDGTGPLILPRTQPTPLATRMVTQPRVGRHRAPARPRRGPGLADSVILACAFVALALLLFAMSVVA